MVHVLVIEAPGPFPKGLLYRSEILTIVTNLEDLVQDYPIEEVMIYSLQVLLDNVDNLDFLATMVHTVYTALNEANEVPS